VAVLLFYYPVILSTVSYHTVLYNTFFWFCWYITLLYLKFCLQKRLQKELQAMIKDPPPGVKVDQQSCSRLLNEYGDILFYTCTIYVANGHSCKKLLIFFRNDFKNCQNNSWWHCSYMMCTLVIKCDFDFWTLTLT
jgi:hypothetical protein